MVVGFQLQARVFTDLLAEGFKRSNLCVADRGPDGVVVDHVEIATGSGSLRPSGTSSSLLRVAGNPPSSVLLTLPGVEYTQPIHVYVTTIDDLRTADLGEPNLTHIPLTVHFNLLFEVIGSTPMLTVDYIAVTALVADPRLDAVNSILRARMPSTSKPLDGIALARTLGATGTPVFAGMAASQDGSLIEFLIEYGVAAEGSRHVAEWQRLFSAGPREDIITNEDWGAYLSKEAVIETIRERFQAAFSKPSKLGVPGGVSPAWGGVGGLPVITVQFHGVIYDACQCFWQDIDVDVEVTCTIRLSVEDGELRQDIHIDHDANDLQQFCCEITAGALWPLVGARMLDGGDIEVKDYLGGLAGGAYLVFWTAIAEAGAQHASNIDLGPQCTQYGDDIVCLSPPDLNGTPTSSCDPPRNERRELTTIRALQDVLVIAGSDDVQPLSAAKVSLEVRQWQWQHTGTTCSVAGTLSRVATLEVKNAGESPLDICGDALVGASAPTYNPYFSRAYHYCPFSETITLEIPGYAEIGEAAEVLVQTSGGARLVTIEPPPPLTKKIEDEFSAYVFNWRARHCYTIPDDWYRTFDRFNLKWLVDPPEGIANPGDAKRLWLVAVAGLNPGENVGLITPDGATVDSATANARGGIALRALLPATPRHDLALQRLPGQTEMPARAVRSQPQLEIRQVILIHQAELKPLAPLLALRAGYSDGQRALDILTTSGAYRYGLSDPSRPRLRTAAPLAHLEGAAAAGEGFLAWTGTDLNELIQSEIETTTATSQDPAQPLTVQLGDIIASYENNAIGIYAPAASQTF